MAGKKGMVTSKRLELPRSFARYSRNPKGMRVKLDGRSAVAHAFRRTADALTSDLGGDLSTQQCMLAERATWLHLHLRRLEFEAATDNKRFNIRDYIGCAQTLTNIIRTLGTERVARPLPRAMEYAEMVAHDETATDDEAAP
jgi:hypothetical protein